MGSLENYFKEARIFARNWRRWSRLITCRSLASHDPTVSSNVGRDTRAVVFHSARHTPKQASPHVNFPCLHDTTLPNLSPDSRDIRPLARKITQTGTRVSSPIFYSFVPACASHFREMLHSRTSATIRSTVHRLNGLFREECMCYRISRVLTPFLK